jgi:GNAT superfamily N-acetyltransferase
VALPWAAEIEDAGLHCWPGLELEYDGAWIRRAANGYTKRANSVQSLDPADDRNAAARLAASAEWLRARGLKPVFRVTPLAGPGILAALDAAGWGMIDHSRLMAMELRPTGTDPRVETYDPLDQRFLVAQQVLQGYPDETQAKLRAVLLALEVPARGIVFHAEDGRPVSSALMAVCRGIVVTGNVVTDAGERRKGYGAAMMQTGLAWAWSAGARVAALNVVADNAGAQALYRGLGYATQYDYAYRVAPR